LGKDLSWPVMIKVAKTPEKLAKLSSLLSGQISDGVWHFSWGSWCMWSFCPNTNLSMPQNKGFYITTPYWNGVFIGG